jgi:uncharacterized protein YprB with RNaseH-like and TPR domain
MPADAFRDRLRTLRREDGSTRQGKAGSAARRGMIAEERPAGKKGGIPPWLARRLGGSQSIADSGQASLGEGFSLDPPTDLAVDEGEHGPWCARENRHACDYEHGDWALYEIDHADREAIALVAGDGALGKMDLRRAVYLDTETTGLSGGAGMHVFMIGLGTFAADGSGFHTWQGFLRGPEEERALLTETARRIRAASGLVTFFGKSFDRHRLEDKMRAAGVIPPFADLPHLDLYHPLRRLYGRAFPDSRLRTMESLLCGFERVGDLPGSQAPAAWMDYLRGRPHRLEGVFRHNLEDVLSLATLAAHLGRVLREDRGDRRPLSGSAASRAAALARLLGSNGRREDSLPWWDLAVARAKKDGQDKRTIAFERAETLRLLHRAAAARSALESFCAAPDDAQTAPALIALAKLLEHQFRDREMAAECCTRALGLLGMHHPGPDGARLERDLNRRLCRCQGL